MKIRELTPQDIHNNSHIVSISWNPNKQLKSNKLYALSGKQMHNISNMLQLGHKYIMQKKLHALVHDGFKDRKPMSAADFARKFHV